MQNRKLGNFVTVPVVDPHFHAQTVSLNIKQFFHLKLFGFAKLKKVAKSGWRGKAWFYVVKCKQHKQHGYFVDYPHGWRGYFSCPKCCEKMG